MKKKQVLAAMLAATMVTSMAPATAFAAPSETIELAGKLDDIVGDQDDTISDEDLIVDENAGNEVEPDYEEVTPDEPTEEVTPDEPEEKEPTVIQLDESYEFAYGDTISITPVIIGSDAEPEITWLNSLGIAMESAPEAVGVYTYSIHVPEDAGFEEAWASATVTIKKTEPFMSMEDMTVTYNGKEQKPMLAKTNSDGKITYGYYSDEKMTQKVAPTNAGTYYVRAKVAETDSFGTKTVKSVLTIKKKTPTVTMEDTKVTWNGKAQAMSAVVKGADAKQKITYGYYTDKEMKNKVAAPTASGTYYVRAKVAADDNHNAKSATAVLTIEKASTKVTVGKTSATFAAADVKKAAKGFNLNAHTSTASATLKYEKVDGSKNISVTSKGTVKVKAGTAKGTYKANIKVTSTSTNNHKAKSVIKEVKIVVK